MKERIFLIIIIEEDIDEKLRDSLKDKISESIGVLINGDDGISYSVEEE
ncbi:hypothetical protein [Helicovermis profundi]|uniref:Uncharacterized protein n=1 Tax=Helicovermis profundi TaxID=3065157 RepID=A0AAU9E2N4_9FIRM|nr:hypothetical protein HLPR_11250 [Clostridia bacterium S502]